jgi:hypothetical protein
MGIFEVKGFVLRRIEEDEEKCLKIGVSSRDCEYLKIWIILFKVSWFIVHLYFGVI